MTRQIPLLLALILSQFIVEGQSPRVTTAPQSQATTVPQSRVTPQQSQITPALRSRVAAGLRSRNLPAPLGAADTCDEPTSEHLYGGTLDDYAGNLITTNDGGYLLIGYTSSFGAGGNDGYIVKVDNLGNVQWSKTYGGPGDDEFDIGIQTSDGGYALGGYTTSFGDPADAWLVKTDPNGNMLWSTKYGDGNPYGERLFSLIQTADGGYAFSGDHKYTPGIVDAMAVRLDANGNILWAKGFDGGGSDESPGIAEDRDSLVVSAFYQNGGLYDAVLMKLEETAGNISWLQSWNFDGRTNRVGTIWVRPDGYMVYGVNSDGFGVTNPWMAVLRTDFNGNLLNIQELHTVPQTMNGALSPTADSGYVVGNFDLPWNPNADVYMTKVRKDGTIDWSRTYPQPMVQSPAGIVPTADGGYLTLASSNQAGNYDLMLVKTDSAGQTNVCPNTVISASIRNPSVTDITYNWANVYNIVFNPSLSITPTVTSPVSADSTLCQTVNLCLDLHITGMDSICNWQNPVTYGSVRDPGCVSPVQWSIDTNYATIVGQTDSTVQLQFRQPGAPTLYGQLGSGCTLVADSMAIQVFHTTPVFLGNDTGFCAGGNVVLNAGSGFQSYTWNTGASTQQIVADSTGTYWVSALNPNSACISADTITVRVFPSPVVNIGPDTIICQDSVHKFNAGTGYVSYLWQDGSTNSYYNASQAGVYWVAVTDTDGCITADTARILGVEPNPKDFLQPTAEICSQGQLPLDLTATGNWSRYLWSDSLTTPSITITAPGQYWLQVSNAAGCTARDTIDVSGKECPFGIYFPNAFTPGGGSNNVFRPIVYAQLGKFYMAVYNRWGTRVFETTDPTQGWDGTFNGQQQGTGTFVWYAQFTLLNNPGKEILDKGTVLLLR